MRRYKIIKGKHREDGKTYSSKDSSSNIIETYNPLATMFPGKFEDLDPVPRLAAVVNQQVEEVPVPAPVSAPSKPEQPAPPTPIVVEPPKAPQRRKSAK